jgi:hypothetical protein
VLQVSGCGLAPVTLQASVWEQFHVSSHSGTHPEAAAPVGDVLFSGQGPQEQKAQ